MEMLAFEEIDLDEVYIVDESNTPIIIGGGVCGFMAICFGAGCGGGCGGLLCGF